MLMTLLFSSRMPPMQCLSSFSHRSSMFGLYTSWPKTKLQSVGSDSGPYLLNVVVDGDGNPVDLVESFTYLVSKRLTDTAGQTSHVELVSFMCTQNFKSIVAAFPEIPCRVVPKLKSRSRDQPPTPCDLVLHSFHLQFCPLYARKISNL